MASKPRFTAHIQHTADTVDRLYRTAHRIYDAPLVLLRCAVGAVLAVCALTITLPVWAKTLLLLVGTWLLAGLDFGSSMRASDAVEARGGSLPRMDYAFYGDHMSLEGEGSMSVPYPRLDRLVWDENFFYLFLARDSVCMLARSTLRGGTEEEFQRFLQEKTGKEWQRNLHLLTLTGWDFVQMIQERRRKRHSQ